MLLLLLAAAQEPAPERFSILVPPPPQECVDRTNAEGDVVVCGAVPELSQRLPLPDEVEPTGPVASNPYLSGTGALAATATPCASVQGGCQVGFGPPLVPIIKGVIGLVRAVTAKKPDKRGRVPIDIGEP